MGMGGGGIGGRGSEEAYLLWYLAIDFFNYSSIYFRAGISYMVVHSWRRQGDRRRKPFRRLGSRTYIPGTRYIAAGGFSREGDWGWALR